MEGNAPELNEREQRILQAVVQLYVTSAEPAGSRALVKRYGLDVSPATVRNVMADLEERGYLTQIHTSSGRVPTDKGYRYYVDYLMRVQELTKVERRRIEEELAARLTDADEVLRQTSHLLALVTHQAGLAEGPAEADALVRHIELLSVGEGRVAVLLIDQYGRVRTLTVSLEPVPGPDQLQKISIFLNEQLRGVNVGDLATTLSTRLFDYLEDQRMLAVQALQILQLVPPQTPARLFLEGAAGLFDQPEFRDMDNARVVFGLLEEKGRLADVLRRAATQEGAGRSRIIIGGEDVGGGLEGLSLVVSPYQVDGKPVGMVGVLGPRRMPYSRLSAVVDYTAGIMGSLMTRFTR